MNTGLSFKRASQPDQSHHASRHAPNLPAPCLGFGGFQLDLQQQQLFKDGLQVKVQGKVYQALVTLIENPGEIVTREALRALVAQRHAPQLRRKRKHHGQQVAASAWGYE
jgi:DNA-binding response OmpR family regulator